ncbi:hypothetical protein G9A89_015370 [Geosiphon pyriformis]|nr:hypothetical protein G9A89_015370 [Geosiphon pyriformis]
MESGSNIEVKSVESKKKRRNSALKDSISNRKIAAMVPSSHFWGSKTGDTTKSDSINMEKEFLVKKTSFDYGENSALADRDLEQTLKSLKIQTKRALGKSLRKIDFLGDNSNDIFLDKPVVLSHFLKNLVNVSVRKSYALDISLDNVIRNSAQKKLMVVRKLFLEINGFGGVSTSSKFAGIIKALFTSESSLA